MSSHRDRRVVRQTQPRSIGGHQVLAGDFHVHSFPFSWGTLSPWDTVLEARRQRLDVVAMTPHNHVWVAKLGRWFSRVTGGPTVLVGEEIVSLPYHLIAVGNAKLASELRAFFGRASMTAIGSSDFHGESRLGYSSARGRSR